MKRGRFTETQFVTILKEADAFEEESAYERNLIHGFVTHCRISTALQGANQHSNR